MVVDRNSKQRFIPCDAELGKTFCEFGSAREGIEPMREGLHGGMQCYMRQHFADRYWLHEHPKRHASWRESTRRKFTKRINWPICRWNVQKMRSESSEYMWKKQEMQTTLLNMYNPKLMETIPKALREQVKEDDHVDTAEEIAGLVPEIPLECEQILKERGGFCDDVNDGRLPEDLVLTASPDSCEGSRPDQSPH